jgi:RNA polymerase sigma-70 factor (sigma-E family)
VTRDDEEYRSFVAARYRTLVRAAVLLGCSPADAEDAAQEALVRCYVAWLRVRAADDPEAYVYRMLVNGVRRARRRRWRGEIPHGDLPEPPAQDDVAGAVAVSHTLRRSLARLPLRQRQVLALRYFADLSESQIADVLGIAPGTVKSRAARAIAALSHDESLGELLLTRHQEDR